MYTQIIGIVKKNAKQKLERCYKTVRRYFNHNIFLRLEKNLQGTSCNLVSKSFHNFFDHAIRYKIEIYVY